MQIDRSRPVLVTGATGYVASWVVKRLLDEGLTVHAAVRSPDDEGKLRHLKALAAASPGKIHFFKADLLSPDSYTPGMQGCSVVFHTASPFTLNVKDPQKELVDPAVRGTRNVLESANQVVSVSRIVLTSSCAAIYGDNADIARAPGGVLTEEVWNETSSLNHQAYSYSKVLAEKEAWKIAATQDRWNLVTLNPSFVIGPGVNPRGTSESFNIIRQMGDGTMKMGAPRMGIGAVDVRDLADAHLSAAFTPSAKGRYIISGHNTDLLEMARTLQTNYGKNYPIPKGSLPKWLVWLIGPLAGEGLTRKMVSLNVDVPWRADSGKGQRELGVHYRPLAESMNDFFAQAIDSGVLRAR